MKKKLHFLTLKLDISQIFACMFQSIDGSTIHFTDDSTAEADVGLLVFCTGYKMDLPFLPQYVKAGMLNEQTNEIQVLNW